LSGIFGTEASLSSDLSLILEVVTTLLFTVGYFSERRSGKHCIVMVAAVVANVLFVVGYMVSRLIREEVPAPPEQFAALYRAVVIPHGILSVLVLALALLLAFLAYRWRSKTENTVVLGSRKRIHGRLGLVTLILWYLSFLTGVVIYIMLYV